MQVNYDDWKLDLITYNNDNWLNDSETLLWSISGEQTYHYVTQFFTEASTLLIEINAEELNRIFWFLIHDILNVLPEEYPALIIWQDYLNATKILFNDLFNVHCAPVLGHYDEQPTTPLNSSCYMWWDILPVWHSDKKSRTEIHNLCLETMTYCLTLDNLACKESALHGLGHWHRTKPQKVQEIITNGDRHIPEKLKNYAQSAARGCVL